MFPSPVPQANKATPDAIKEEVNALLALKQQYKQLTGKDFVAAGVPAPVAPKKKDTPAPAAPAEGKKAPVKDTKQALAKAAAVVEEKLDFTSLVLFCGNASEEDLLRCVLVAQALKKELKVARTAPASVAERTPYYPALVVPSIASSSGYASKLGTVIFGSAAVCQYLALDCAAAEGALPAALEEAYMDLLEDAFSKSSSGE
jgi:hypothetical protein